VDSRHVKTSRNETQGIVRVRPRKTNRLKLLREHSRREFSKTSRKKTSRSETRELAEVRLRKTSSCEPLPCKENPIYVFLFWELRGLSPNFYIHVSVCNLYIPGIGPHISSSRIGRPSLEIYKSLTNIRVYRNWETELCKSSVLEITVSFLGIHKWEADIYIGFSPALHLQCERRVYSRK
jgi:hypothetical protein